MAEAQPSYLDRIETNPRVMVGKPVVKGTRIPVERVLHHLQDNFLDREDLFAAFPELTEDDLKGCLQYARGFLVVTEQSVRAGRGS